MDNKLCLKIPQGPYGAVKFYGKEIEKYRKKNSIQLEDQLTFSIDVDGNNFSGKRIVYLWSSYTNLGEKMKGLCASDCIVTRDDETKRFLEKRMNLYSHVLPMFGLKSKKIKKFEERKIPVFFPGSYLEEHSTLSNIEKVYPKVMCEIAIGSIRWMEKEKNYHLRSGICSYLSQEGIEYSEDMIYSYLEIYGYLVEDYIRRKLRNQIINILLKSQIPVHVCGANWNILYEKLDASEQKYLYVHGQNLSIEAISDLMANSKVVLNISPNLHGGLHERVTMAMINGAICVTDENDYILEEFQNRNVVELFSFAHLKNLPGRIKKILCNEEEWEVRSEHAIQMANSTYTVENFWNQICEWSEGE